MERSDVDTLRTPREAHMNAAPIPPSEQNGGNITSPASFLKLSPKPAPDPLGALESRLGTTEEDIRLAAKLAATLVAPEQVVLFSSIDGATDSGSVAARVAVGLSRLNRGPVLLIDAHLQEPSLHTCLDLPAEPGLSDLLLRKAELATIVRPLVPGSLSLVPAGRPSSQARSLLSVGFPLLVEYWRKHFSWILVNGSPLFAADASCLVPRVDGTVLVVASGKHRKEDLVGAKRELDSLHAKLLGVVISQEEVLPQPRQQMAWSYGRVLDRVLPVAILVVAFAIGYVWDSGRHPAQARAASPKASLTPRPQAGIASTQPTRQEAAEASSTIVISRVPLKSAAASAKNPVATTQPITLAGSELRLDPAPQATVIQVAALPHEPAALALAETLRQDQYHAFVSHSGPGAYYRVQIGPFTDAAAADRVAQELKQKGFDIYVRYQKPNPPEQTKADPAQSNR
jgi:protein-tyrosine kinase